MKTLLTISFFFLFLQASMGQNVGIGTTTPQRRLDVVGGIRTDSLLLHSGAGENAVLSLTIADVITFAQNLQADYFVSDPLAIGQSVTAEVSDTLHYISVFTSAPIEADTIKIYEGEGLSGPLLASGTMEDGSGWVKSSLLNLYLEEGEQYTFWLDNIHYVYFTVDGAYPGGGVMEGDSSSSVADITFSLNKVIGSYVPMRVTGQGDYPNQLPSPFPGAQMELNGHLSVTSLSLAHGAENGSVMTGDSSGNFSWKPLAWSVDQYGIIKPSNPESHIALGISNPLARFHIGGSTDMMIGNYDEAGHDYPFTIFGDGDIRFLSSDGLPRLYMNGDQQNVGIGTFAQPGEKLSVGGKLVAHEIKLGLGATEGYVLTSDASGNASWQSPSSLWTQNGDHISNATTGNVGIGQSSPVYKLDVAGTAKFTGSIHTLDRVGIGKSPGCPLDVLNHNTIPIAHFEGDESNPRVIEIQKGDRLMTIGLIGNAAVIGPNNDGLDSDLALWTNGTSKVTIKPDGKVGIGTEFPAEKLTVGGKIQTLAFQMLNTAGAGKLMVSDAGGTATWTDPIWSGSGSTFFLANGSGNVGVGISAPTSKLEVEGTMTADQIKMTTSPGLNKVMTSDANGLASWTSPTWSWSGLNVFSNAFKVGIGTGSPLTTLHVNGHTTLTGNLSVSQDATVTGNLSVGGIVQSGYTLVALNGNGYFLNWGGDYEVPRFYKDKENVVHLEGLIHVTSPISNTWVFQLPVGFRPTKTHVFATMDSNSIVRLDVDNLGFVKLMDIPAESFLTLDGISFRAE